MRRVEKLHVSSLLNLAMAKLLFLGSLKNLEKVTVRFVRLSFRPKHRTARLLLDGFL
jgi:hypothetical protein